MVLISDRRVCAFGLHAPGLDAVENIDLWDVHRLYIQDGRLVLAHDVPRKGFCRDLGEIAMADLPVVRTLVALSPEQFPRALTKSEGLRIDTRLDDAEEVLEGLGLKIACLGSRVHGQTLSVGRILLARPAAYEYLTTSSADFRAARAGADRLSRAFAPTVEGDQEQYAAFSSMTLLVEGDYERLPGRNGKLSLVGGTDLLVTAVPKPFAGAHIWAAGILTSVARDSVLTVGAADTYRRVAALQPKYHGLTLAQSFLRSRLVTSLLDHIVWPEEFSKAQVELIVHRLQTLHAPNDMKDAEYAWSPEVMGPLVDQLGPYDPVFWGHFQSVLKADRAAEGHQSRISGLVLPPPRLVKTARGAEEYAAEVFEALGFTGVYVTPPGADGGIDVQSDQAVAQVKMEAIATGRPVVQALVGVAAVENKDPIFFSLSGYTAGALQWAERAGVACFEFSYDGSIEARTSQAELLLEHGT